jgi:GPH family glycoside/pentoside/hexuronide:cation symporter
MAGKKLSLGTKLGFGICDLGGNLFFTIMGFYLLFYLTDTSRLIAGLAGTALLVGKLADAFVDPVVGFLSDRTRSRWGRRRPFMFVGSILLLVFMVVMYTNPHIASQLWLFIWATAAYILLMASYSLVNIPYGALTPELSPDFDERTTLNAFRMTFAVVGTFVGAALVLTVVGAFANKDTGWMAMGAIMGAVMTLTAMTTVFTVREPAPKPQDLSRKQEGIVETYLSALKLKPFVLAMVPYALHIFGVTIVQGALLYYFKYIYNAEGQFQTALTIFLVCVIISIPLWTLISKRIGKKLSYNLGMGLFAAVVIAFFFVGKGRGVEVMYVTMAIAGLGNSTNYVMPFSILPDVTELDYANTGVRREGVFYGLWNFTLKVGQALATFVIGWILSAFGYVPDVAQSASSILGIRLLVGPIAAVFFVAGVVVLSFYPITRKYYDTEIMPKVAAWDRKKKA